MNNNISSKKKNFESPEASLVVFEANDVISTSGGFDGKWDELSNSAQDVDLPKISV